MTPLQITAHLSRPLATTDSLSPAIEGLIEYKLREELGLLDPNPQKLEEITQIDLPLLKNKLGFYHCSSPHYLYGKEEQVNFRKRWDYQDRHLDWGKKKAKFDTSQGQFKSYDMPLFLRTISRIDWFVVGEQETILRLLKNATHLGKKRSQGYGLVTSWTAQEIPGDWSIIGPDNRLRRPVPVELFTPKLPEHKQLAAWKLPSWHHESTSLCWVPSVNIKQENCLAS